MVQACRGICVPEWKSSIAADEICLCISGGTNRKSLLLNWTWTWKRQWWMVRTAGRCMCWLQGKATPEMESFHPRNNFKDYTLPWDKLRYSKVFWEVLDRYILSEPALGEWGVLKPLKEAPRCTLSFPAVLSWVGHAVQRNTTALFDVFSWQENKELTWVRKWATIGWSITTKGLKNILQVWYRGFWSTTCHRSGFYFPIYKHQGGFLPPLKMHEFSLTPKNFGPVPSLDCRSQSLITSQDKFNNSWLLFYSMLTKSHLESGETSIKATEIQNIRHISDCNTFIHFFWWLCWP